MGQKLLMMTPKNDSSNSTVSTLVILVNVASATLACSSMFMMTKKIAGKMWPSLVRRHQVTLCIHLSYSFLCKDYNFFLRILVVITSVKRVTLTYD